jgi:hypothetical protein
MLVGDVADLRGDVADDRRECLRVAAERDDVIA